jgi:hypothetical protein
MIALDRETVYAKEKKSVNPRHDRSPNSHRSNLQTDGKRTFLQSRMWIALDYCFQQRSKVFSFGDFCCPVRKIEIFSCHWDGQFQSHSSHFAIGIASVSFD